MGARRIPPDEVQRLAALHHATRLPGSAPEEAFDRITRMASRVTGAPIALVSLVGKDVQWFKSRCGFEPHSTARDVSFCGHAILSDEPMVVPDATRDRRFAGNPIVPDHESRTLDQAGLECLGDLARMVEQLIYHRQLAMAAQSLTESLSMAGAARSVVVMRQLRERGVTLSIGDFGTGHASFAYLTRLPVDKLKIDRSFIDDMAHSPESLAIVQAMIAMAHRSRLTVIAEGVETADQVAAPRRAECDQIQGYYFSKPLRAADCAAWIRERIEQAA